MATAGSLNIALANCSPARRSANLSGNPSQVPGRYAQQLRVNGNFSDAAIFCGERVFRAHKAVLCPVSPFFSAAFSVESVDRVHLDRRIATPKAVDAILRYLYDRLDDTATVFDFDASALQHPACDVHEFCIDVASVAGLFALYPLRHRAMRRAAPYIKNALSLDPETLSKLLIQIVDRKNQLPFYLLDKTRWDADAGDEPLVELLCECLWRVADHGTVHHMFDFASDLETRVLTRLAQSRAPSGFPYSFACPGCDSMEYIPASLNEKEKRICKNCSRSFKVTMWRQCKRSKKRAGNRSPRKEDGGSHDEDEPA